MDVRFVVVTRPEIEVSCQEFLVAKRQEGRAAGTVKKYEFYLGKFCEWCAARGIDALAGLTRVALREWGAELHEGRSRATVRTIVTVIRSFLGWCYEERMIEYDLRSALKAPPDKVRMLRTVTAEEVEAMIAACDLTTPLGVRDAAIVSMLIDTGLRASELVTLRVDDVHFDARLGSAVVSYVQSVGKGGDEKPAFFGATTAERLRAWLAVRMARPGVETVFVSLSGNTPLTELTRNGLLDICLRLCAAAGLPPASPHAFRRGFACIANDAGASTRDVQLLGRWSDIRMVVRYTQALEAGKRYNAHSPADYARRNAPDKQQN